MRKDKYEMREIICTICLLLILLSGCSSVQTTATFRGQHIVVGQSSDSIENLLGQPDWACSARIAPFSLKVKKIDPWVNYGPYTIEWGYWGDPDSLLLWLEGNAVQAIWLVKSSRLK